MQGASTLIGGTNHSPNERGMMGSATSTSSVENGVPGRRSPAKTIPRSQTRKSLHTITSSEPSDPQTLELISCKTHPILVSPTHTLYHHYSVSLGNVVRGILGDGIASRSGGATPPVVISSSSFPLLLRLLLHSATHHLTSLTITQSSHLPSHQIPLSPEGVASTENGAVVLDQLKWGSGDDKSYQWLMSVLSNYSYESYEGTDLVVDDTYVYTFFSPIFSSICR